LNSDLRPRMMPISVARTKAGRRPLARCIPAPARCV